MTQGTIVRSISYTADGNALQDNLGTGAVFTYGYNNDNRMVQAALGGATQASYTLNYLGQRVIKAAAGSGTIHFHYDRGGHLIAESDGAGNVLREYVFLGDMPVAFVTPTGGIDIIHTDHLGTPQKMTDASQAVVWDGGASDPFMMSHLPLTPAMNVRFPGQYYDGETGLHYNYFRDYDPSLGRYVESDPIGLGGGINTYAYVRGNPLNYSDPSGRMSAPALVARFAVGAELPGLGIGILAGEFLYWALEKYFPVACDTPPYYNSTGDSGNSGASNPGRGATGNAPPVPDELVGTPPNKSRPNRTNSGPLDPSFGGTGDAGADFNKLTGGTGAPPPEGSTLPSGSQVGDNGITLRPGPDGPRIDIPSKGSKPAETLHYPGGS